MTDWEKLKVVDLKEELKSRGIPLTGLKLKQQFIDKLNEVEADGKGEDLHEEPGDDGSPGKLEDQDRENNEEESQPNQLSLSSEQEVVKTQGDINIQDAPDTIQGPVGPSVVEDKESTFDDEVAQDAERSGKSISKTPPADELTGEERLERLPDELPPALKKEESQARDGSTPPPVDAQIAAEVKSIETYDPFLPQESMEQPQAQDRAGEDSSNAPKENSPSSEKAGPDTSASIEEIKSSTDAAQSTHVPTQEILDDQRKRKRRSVTPVPHSDDVARKRTKTNGESSIPTERESSALQQVQEATNAAQQVRNPGAIDNDTPMQSLDVVEDRALAVESADHAGRERAAERLPSNRQAQIQSRSPSVSSTIRDVSPAIHPATRSLYIRNFKRPLHIPTLRKHVLSLAGSSNEDPIKVFYLDNIRTHAFITFSSISSASRVRNAMHGTRFPDEPMRETLWVDFVPDEKVQAWIDEESGAGSGGFGGGRGSSKKHEVVYNETKDGIDAILQPATNLSTQLQRPAMQQSTSNRMVPQDPTASAAVASGIHPSRMSQVPQSPSALRSQQRPEPKPSSHPSDPGKGFRALDELFSSTATKPRLYYKLPSKPVIDDRLDMMRDLRAGYDQMGQSGDEGMKRYSFEKDERSGQEEWVDKGPEFGFGKRGQERLTGAGSHYGGRGRGVFRGSRRGGDSWRGR